MSAPTGEGWRSSGYAELNVIQSPDGPAIAGRPPARIGVDRAMLDEMVPALGSWTEETGTLVVLGHHYQLIGIDGTDVVVFDRCPA